MQTIPPSTQRRHTDKHYPSFKAFHELMAWKVQNILLVSSPYDAFIMEEDGRLAGRIIDEYRGLNLSRPPRLSWVSTAEEAFNALARETYDIVITMPRLDGMAPYELGRKIKETTPALPVFLLTHSTAPVFVHPDWPGQNVFDKVYVWSGNTDLLLALIKNVEDRMNVDFDTQHALVRVIVLVEDSPIYASSIIPLLYKEIVTQTQRVMEESINEEHRLLRMRARPKILVAETYEEAEALYRRFTSYLLCVISDVRFPRNGKMDDRAGIRLLSMIKEENPNIALLHLSSDEKNRKHAQRLSIGFINKNAPTLLEEIRHFFVDNLGFGDFIFRLPTGETVGRAENLRAMEKALSTIPSESLYFHGARNDFSIWLMARAEVQLASELRPVKVTDFTNEKDLRGYLVSCIQNRRKGQQRGHIIDFMDDDFDPENDFTKIGKGSLGGKARSLAFISSLLKENPRLQKSFPTLDIRVPKTLAITTEGFDAFLSDSGLKDLPFDTLTDEDITERFLAAPLPGWLTRKLEIFLASTRYPLAVRSSSLLEDAQFQPFAGIYQTHMLPNNDPDPAIRLGRLLDAVKRVYASTFLAGPRTYASGTIHRIEEEKMAVIIQQIAGSRYGPYFYPALSGMVQSYNFYAISHLKPEDGVAHIAVGLGKTVVEGGASLRFSPAHPQFLPGFSTVEEILANSQHRFYALDMTDGGASPLIQLDIDQVRDHPPIRRLSSTYNANEHRIRDAGPTNGHPVLTFAAILKYDMIPLPALLAKLLVLGRKGLGCPVEIEFALTLADEWAKDRDSKPCFSLLQIRPMAYGCTRKDMDIHPEDVENAFCYSSMAMGNGSQGESDRIVYVKPDAFDPSRTIEIANEIGRINQLLKRRNRKYLLIGPGRWGSADRWLGIPVKWHDISQAVVIVETTAKNLQAVPSQGTHFFHNITSMGTSYLTVQPNESDFVDWEWLQRLPVEKETPHARLVRCPQPFTVKINDEASVAVLMK
jgi:DNA-binding NarL/FixJ family response regulator